VLHGFLNQDEDLIVALRGREYHLSTPIYKLHHHVVAGLFSVAGIYNHLSCSLRTMHVCRGCWNFLLLLLLLWADLCWEVREGAF
jgi:hypothetical protein